MLQFRFTEEERNFHREALKAIVKRFRYLKLAEAIEGLEHGAMLLADDS